MTLGVSVDRTWKPRASPHTSAREQDFCVLVGANLNDLYGYARWLAHDHVTAQDLVQETLLRAWRSLHRLRNPDSIKGWLLTILRRESARFFERQRPLEGVIPVEELVDSRCNYDTSTEAFVLRQAIADLPKAYRDPLLLQVVYGYSLAEIARHLKVSEAGAATRLFRARQQLRATLGELDETSGTDDKS